MIDDDHPKDFDAVQTINPVTTLTRADPKTDLTREAEENRGTGRRRHADTDRWRCAEKPVIGVIETAGCGDLPEAFDLCVDERRTAPSDDDATSTPPPPTKRSPAANAALAGLRRWVDARRHSDDCRHRPSSKSATATDSNGKFGRKFSWNAADSTFEVAGGACATADRLSNTAIDESVESVQDYGAKSTDINPRGLVDEESTRELGVERIPVEAKDDERTVVDASSEMTSGSTKNSGTTDEATIDNRCTRRNGKRAVRRQAAAVTSGITSDEFSRCEQNAYAPDQRSKPVDMPVSFNSATDESKSADVDAVFDSRVAPDDDESTASVVEVPKTSMGVGFCIEGGIGSPSGDRPITVKRIFKGMAITFHQMGS